MFEVVGTTGTRINCIVIGFFMCDASYTWLNYDENVHFQQSVHDVFTLVTTYIVGHELSISDLLSISWASHLRDNSDMAGS